MIINPASSNQVEQHLRASVLIKAVSPMSVRRSCSCSEMLSCDYHRFWCSRHLDGWKEVVSSETCPVTNVL